MSTNRVLQFIRPRPQHCTCQAINDAREERARLTTACEAIESEADYLEFSMPSVYRLAGMPEGNSDSAFQDEPEGPPAVKMYVHVKCDPATLTVDASGLRMHAVQQLRAISRELAECADELEAGKGGAQ